MDVQFHNDPQKYVAHYTRLATALDHILPNRKLRLGPLTKTNDPRETKTWVFSVAGSPRTQAESAELRRLAKGHVEYSRLLKTGCKVLCVACDAPNALKLNFADRCYGKVRMWAQYADNHQGLCLVFDKDLLAHEIEESLGSKGKPISGEVRYWDFGLNPADPEWSERMDAFMLSGEAIANDGLEAVLHKMREKHFVTYFFQKNTDWKSEAEFRWIFFGDDDEPEYVPIGTSLKGIIVGCDFPSNRLSEVRDFCEEFNVYFARIRWFNGFPDVTWVRPEDLRVSPLFA